MADQNVHFPQTIGIWTRSDMANIIDSTNIFNYMNGAGELYLAYRFDHLEVYEYTTDNQEDILVEVYKMDTPDDAFGLLSLDWGGEPVELDPAASEQSDSRISPPVRSLYGGGLLRIWADTIYARIIAKRETAESKETVLSLGRIVAINRKKSPEPQLLKNLPNNVNSVWKLRNDRIGYFRSHLVLNSLYYLSHENILFFDHTTEAVTAPYRIISNTVSSKQVQILLVKYASVELAQKALDRFHEAYLAEHQKGFINGSTEGHMNVFEIEDVWVGYAINKAYLTIVFECPDRETGQRFLERIPNSERIKGNSHDR